MLKDPQKIKDEIVHWCREYFKKNGPNCCAVVGVSGGKDSSVVAALCAEALGKDRVVGVMMPNGVQADLEDSERLIKHLGIRGITVNIAGAFDSLAKEVNRVLDISEKAEINLPPRLRMATLYAVAQSLPNGGRVANTCNRSEDYVGYSTKYGDSVGDFSLLSNLVVHEVRQIGHALALPADLVDKVPSDGLCGKTDEENLGFTYDQLDHHILYGFCGNEEVDAEINRLNRVNEHKMRPMPGFVLYSKYERT
jgi:NAD+ synthase